MNLRLDDRLFGNARMNSQAQEAARGRAGCWGPPTSASFAPYLCVDGIGKLDLRWIALRDQARIDGRPAAPCASLQMLHST